ncbi:hypothetical protein STEG23_012104, partial [Scotinomys teguina]
DAMTSRETCDCAAEHKNKQTNNTQEDGRRPRYLQNRISVHGNLLSILHSPLKRGSTVTFSRSRGFPQEGNASASLSYPTMTT